MRHGTDRHRSAHSLQLLGALVQAHLVHDVDRREQAERRRAAAFARGLRASHRLQDAAIERFVATEREVQALARIQPLGEDFVEAVDRVRRFGAEALARALDAEALAGPGLSIGVARADEQGEAFGIGRVEQARRLGLGESGQVVEVVVLPVGVFDVPRAHRDGRGREQRERSRG